MIRATVLACAIAGGCAFPAPSGEYACVTTADCDADRVCDRGFCVAPGDDGGGNGAPDAASAPDASLAELCAGWTATHFDPCAIVAPSAALVLAGENTFDTTTGVLSYPGGQVMPAGQLLPSGRLISVTAFSVAPGARLRVIGTRPLVIASWSTIEIATGGVIDASSGAAGDGAGANPAACAAHAAQVGQDAGVGAGGGGGGGYGGAGGDGGTGDGGDGGAAGAVVAAAAAAIDLLGGCRGAAGGDGDQPGGPGGPGGGVIQLTARKAIAIDGTVHAGGSGGSGALGTDGGGGGGGSGGLVGLDAATISIGASAAIAANGGGGGAGSNAATGGRGADGAASATGAAGGLAEANAGAGGNGAAGARLAGWPGAPSTDHGAGGGGGGVGVIAVISDDPAFAVPPSAVVSPALTRLAP